MAAGSVQVETAPMHKTLLSSGPFTRQAGTMLHSQSLQFLFFCDDVKTSLPDSAFGKFTPVVTIDPSLWFPSVPRSSPSSQTEHGGVGSSAWATPPGIISAGRSNRTTV